jgi:hypothetical protein
MGWMASRFNLMSANFFNRLMFPSYFDLIKKLTDEKIIKRRRESNDIGLEMGLADFWVTVGGKTNMGCNYGEKV